MSGRTVTEVRLTCVTQFIVSRMETKSWRVSSDEDEDDGRKTEKVETDEKATSEGVDEWFHRSEKDL